MPLILDSMLCKIVNLSKDSKPTKIKIKEKLQCCIVKMPRYLGDVVSLGWNVLQGVDGDVQHVKCIVCSSIWRKDMTLGVKLYTFKENMLGNESQQKFATHWNEKGWNVHEQTMLTCWKTTLCT